MNGATRRVTQGIIDIWSEVPLVEQPATADDVQSFVCGHVRWLDGTPGPAIELEDIDFTTVDWDFVLKRCMQPCRSASSVVVIGYDL